ncbi:MAG: YdeI/OmpD-associated family protein [Bacteroidota bacterium]
MEYEAQRADGVATTYAASPEDWRNWLAQNHDLQRSVWLIIYKKDSGVPSLTYSEAVDEALCFGWIDSKPNKRDADSFYQYFSARKSKSNWSRVNKEKIARLQAAGKLAPAGEEMVRLAKEIGTWDALNEVEDLIIPQDMLIVFDQYPAVARQNWEAFPRSVKRGILEWIFNAKRPPTRAKRIDQTVSMAAENKRANQFR